MTLPDFLASDVFYSVLRALVVLLAGIPLIWAVSRFVSNACRTRVSAKLHMLIVKFVQYAGFCILVVVVLHNMGFQLGALLGTAGIVGVAVGFASKTSLSNIISGFFMIGENAFTIGDLIEAGAHRGYVMSIDLLSVKLRTTDNRMVRVPNESLLQDSVINITRFPIRRMEYTIGVAYREDLRTVARLLKQVAAENEWVLDEPEPAVQMINFADSACEFWVAVWFERENWGKVRETFLTDVKACFDANDIEIPFPHRTIYTGSRTEPMPLTVSVETAAKGSGGPDGPSA